MLDKTLDLILLEIRVACPIESRLVRRRMERKIFLSHVLGVHMRVYCYWYYNRFAQGIQRYISKLYRLIKYLYSNI